MNDIPEDFEQFLYWVKETTEKRWANFSVSKKDGNWWNHKHDLFEGAKWINQLDEAEIDDLEIKWNIKFSKNHRSFLKILHTVDKHNAQEDDETGEIYIDNLPLFHDWRNEKMTAERFDFPFKLINEDVFDERSKCWLKSWGQKPGQASECLKIIASWRKKMPVVVPVNSNRYQAVSEDGQDGHILSTYGFDTLLYSLDFKQHLLHELRWDLGLDEREYEYEEENSKPAPFMISNAINELEQDEKTDSDNFAERENEYATWLAERRKAYQPIPYWEELILYYSSGWDTIGLQFPGERYGTIAPIVRADSLEQKNVL